MVVERTGMGVNCVLPKNRVPQSPSVRGGKTAGRPPTPGLLLRDSVILAFGLVSLPA